MGSLVFVEELTDGSDVDAVRYKSAFESEATLCAEVAFKIGTVHAFALLAIFHAQVERVGWLGHVDRHHEPNQQRHDGHGGPLLAAVSDGPLLRPSARVCCSACRAVHFM